MYLIKRGPRPSYHKAPFHPVIICPKKRIAKWEAGATDERAWVWSNEVGGVRDGCGWLLERWNGLDIDYGHVVRDVGPLPDGTHTAFFHRHLDLGYDRPGQMGAKHLGYSSELQEPWTLLSGAIWWDNRKMPNCLLDIGVIYPPDEFTQQQILNLIAEDGCSGFRREVPKHWNTNQETPEQ